MKNCFNTLVHILFRAAENAVGAYGEDLCRYGQTVMKVVGGKDDGSCSAKFTERAEDADAVFGIEKCRRLVKQDDRGLADDSGSYSRLLEFTVAEGGYVSVFQMIYPFIPLCC